MENTVNTRKEILDLLAKGKITADEAVDKITSQKRRVGMIPKSSQGNKQIISDLVLAYIYPEI